MIDNHPDAVYARQFFAQEESRKKWRIRKYGGAWQVFEPNKLVPYASYARWQSAINSVRYFAGQKAKVK